MGRICDATANRKFTRVLVMSPFLTKPGAKYLINTFGKKKNLQLQALTNLSLQNIAFSLANPIEPLQALQEAFGNRLEIRWNANLHAKLYYAPPAVMLFGSSNMTGGGMNANIEINCLMENTTKDQRLQMDDIDNWAECADAEQEGFSN